METQSALVGAYGTVELHAITDVHMHLALVIHPGHTEGDDTLGFHNAFNQFGLLKPGMLVIHILNGNKHFSHGLQVFCLTRMLTLQVLHDFFHFHSIIVFLRWLPAPQI